eukprot:5105755-Pyramimonas_sp.AAC.1
MSSEAVLEGVPGPSWMPSWASWRPLGPSGGPLGAVLWGVLGPFCGHPVPLGRSFWVLGPSRAVGRSNRS